MVYSPELGYDLDEWEECPPPTHFLAFSAHTRVALALLTIALSVIFFWILRKSDTHVEHESAKIRKQSLIEDIKRYSQPNIASTLVGYVEKTIRDSSATRSPRRRSLKRSFTPQEREALLDWEHEVKATAELRSRVADATYGETTSTFGLASNAFENQSLLSGPSPDVTKPSVADIKPYPAKHCIVTETPPSTPPDGVFTVASNEHNLRHKLARDLNEKLLAETNAPNRFFEDTNHRPIPLSGNARRISTTEIDDTTADDIEFIDRRVTADGRLAIIADGSVAATSAQISPLSQQTTCSWAVDGGELDQSEDKAGRDPELVRVRDEYELERMQELLRAYEDVNTSPEIAVENVPGEDSPGGFNVVYSVPTTRQKNETGKESTRRVLSRDTLSDDRTPYELLDAPPGNSPRLIDENKDGGNQHVDNAAELAEAELYLKEVMAEVNTDNSKFVFNSSTTSSQRNFQSPDSGHAFVMEEDMLESDKHPDEPIFENFPRVPNVSQRHLDERHTELKPLTDVTRLNNSFDGAGGGTVLDATSALIKTNEVFEKPESVADDDADDAMTYAPEIQSEEISPDQISENENSLNLVENYLGRRESPPKWPVATNQPPAGPLVIGDTHKEISSGTEYHKAAKSDKHESQLPPALSLPRPAPPALFSLKSAADSGGDRSAASQTTAKKIPKFMRRNVGIFDDSESTTTTTTSKSLQKQSSLMSALGVTSTQEALLKLTNLDQLSEAMGRAGLELTNLIFGIDYTASNKYQGEHSFGGRSLHCLSDTSLENPYQQVIKIMGRTLAPFSSNNGIPLFGFGDLTTGDWSVFPLNADADDGRCHDLDEVLRIYNAVTPIIDLSGPTNFAPLIYRAISICQKIQDYHILVIIADGQVTNERATRKAIVHACQYPLSIIVVGVGDGPWDMMKVFDESLPKRPWDNFHFVEFHEIVSVDLHDSDDPDATLALNFAVHSLLEVPDQYRHIRKLGLIRRPSLTAHDDDGAQTPLPPAVTNA